MLLLPPLPSPSNSLSSEGPPSGQATAVPSYQQSESFILSFPLTESLKVHVLDKPRLSQSYQERVCLLRVFFLSCQYSPGDRQVTVYCQCSFCPAVRQTSGCLLRVFFLSCQYLPGDRQVTVYCQCSFCPAVRQTSDCLLRVFFLSLPVFTRRQASDCLLSVFFLSCSETDKLLFTASVLSVLSLFTRRQASDCLLSVFFLSLR